MSARRIAMLGIVLVALVSACGVPTHEDAREVKRKDVPFELLNEQAGPPVSEPVGAEEKVIYFARDERLVPTTRRLDPSTTLTDLLDALGRGPNRNEVEAGLRSALPDESTFPEVTVSRGTARVDLGRRFTSLSSSD